MSKKAIILLVAGIFLMLVASIGATLFIAKTYLAPHPETDAKEAAAAAKPAAVPDPVYFTIDPAFVVNIQDGARMRFFQLQVDIMARDPAVIKRFEKYQPRIKGELTMLYGGVTSEQIYSPEGRTSLQKSTLETINKVLTEESGEGGIQAVYFTKFVVQ